MAGLSQLAAQTRSRLMRARANHHAIPHDPVGKVEFLHVQGLRGEYVAIFLLQLGEGI